MYTTLTASAYLGENANAEWELYQQELTWNEKKKKRKNRKKRYKPWCYNSNSNGWTPRFERESILLVITRLLVIFVSRTIDLQGALMLIDCIIEIFSCDIIGRFITQNYSGIPVTRTLKGNKKLFELVGFRVFRVDSNIQFFRFIINRLFTVP